MYYDQTNACVTSVNINRRRADSSTSLSAAEMAGNVVGAKCYSSMASRLWAFGELSIMYTVVAQRPPGTTENYIRAGYADISGSI